MLNKNIKTVFLSILISALVCSQIGNAGYIGDSGTVIRLGKFSIMPYAFVIEPYNSTHIQSINASGYVYQSTNANATINNAIGNITTSGKDGQIFIKSGTYSNVDLILYDGSHVPSVSLIGEANPTAWGGVIFTGSSATMVRTNATGWIQGANGAFHTIENIRFSHTTQSATDQTLQFNWTMVSMKNVWVSNANTTKQGTGIFIGTNNDTGSYTGNTGHPISWQDITVASYDVNFNVSVDHLSADNLVSYYADTCNFNWRWSAWSMIRNLQIAPESGGATDAYMLYFEYLGQGLEMYGVNIEASGTTFNQDVIYYANEFHAVEIDGFFMQGTMGNIDVNHTARFWVRGSTNGTAEYMIRLNSYGGSFLSESFGSCSNYNNTNTVSHGLLNVPYFISVTSSNTSAIIIIRVAYTSATLFTVYMHDEAGNAVTGQSFRWFATVNRK